MKLAALMLTVLFYFSCSQITKKESSGPTSLEKAVSSDFRFSEYKKRDKYRHPLETLQFFGIRPDMTVIEISPGAGWYTEILAPYLTPQGQYIMAMPPRSNAPYAIANAVRIKSIMDRDAKIAANIKTVEFNPSKELTMVEPGTADMVLTFRNVHNWMENNADLAAFQSFYEALKPGGILGVVEHRAGPNTAPSGKSGYVPEAYVIDLAQKAGFKLVAKSEINANPKDTKDYPEGVWTLPPTLRLGEKDKKKYLEIGESDRMTLKFVKE